MSAIYNLFLHRVHIHLSERLIQIELEVLEKKNLQEWFDILDAIQLIHNIEVTA